jgi:hypothetical protein
MLVQEQTECLMLAQLMADKLDVVDGKRDGQVKAID